MELTVHANGKEFKSFYLSLNIEKIDVCPRDVIEVIADSKDGLSTNLYRGIVNEVSKFGETCSIFVDQVELIEEVPGASPQISSINQKAA